MAFVGTIWGLKLTCAALCLLADVNSMPTLRSHATLRPRPAPGRRRQQPHEQLGGPGPEQPLRTWAS